MNEGRCSTGKTCLAPVPHVRLELGAWRSGQSSWTQRTIYRLVQIENQPHLTLLLCYLHLVVKYM